MRRALRHAAHVACLCVALLGGAVAVAHAQPRDTPAASQTESSPAPSTSAPASPGAPTTPAAAPAGDGWDFDDEPAAAETHVATWQEQLQPNLRDLLLTAAFLTFALVSFFLRSKPLKYAALVGSVAYLGVMKSRLLSVTDIFRLVDLDFPHLWTDPVWYLLAGTTVVTTLLFGRLYCGRICAFGALTQLLDAVVPARLRWEPSLRWERRASVAKFVLLGGTVAYYVLSHDFRVYRYVEPFWMYTRTATPLLWAMLGTLLLASLVVRNLYCRFLCPVGAALGLIAQVTTLFRIKRWRECTTCKKCEKACEWGAIQGPRIIRTECVRCDDCERIYHDQSASTICVHWMILHRNAQKLAASTAPANGSR